MENNKKRELLEKFKDFYFNNSGFFQECIDSFLASLPQERESQENSAKETDADNEMFEQIEEQLLLDFDNSIVIAHFQQNLQWLYNKYRCLSPASNTNASGQREEGK